MTDHQSMALSAAMMEHAARLHQIAWIWGVVAALTIIAITIGMVRR